MVGGIFAPALSAHQLPVSSFAAAAAPALVSGERGQGRVGLLLPWRRRRRRMAAV